MAVCFGYWLGISSIMFFIAYLFNAHFSLVQVFSLTVSPALVSGVMYRVYIVFKYNAWSNLAQEIQFWEFMSGSILIDAHSNCLICMYFISNKYSRQFLSPLKWLTSPVHASWTWAKPRDLHIRLSLPIYRQFLLLEEYATWCWWAWLSEYTCQVRECLMEVACSL